MAVVLREDFDLKAPDLQALSSRERVVELFTLLGYNTDARLVQTTDAMGLTADTLKHQIRHIERIADQENGALQVYLAEMRSVTVANTQSLARSLKNRGTSFLWVLTSDYERLDFVLFEPTLPLGASASGIGFKGAFLRPRVLTVSRRNPTSIDLRVLRRFSYTEADADYQFQKLQSAYNIADWTEEYFNNRALFSDYYLKHRLQDRSEWRENPAPIMRTFHAMFAEVRSRLVGQKEEVIRTHVFEPAFKTLGFTFQSGKMGSSDTIEPDYYLYAPNDQSKPLAYCSTYIWDRTLDGRDETRDTETPDENPGAMVVSLLDREGAPEWAIVTNGKLWRLYSARAHSRATNYYEIDLEEALASPDPSHAFRYFWLLFRADGFSERVEGQSFLNQLLDASALYAKELEDRLKDRVFAEIFPRFAEGFITDIRAREGTGAELGTDRLNEVFQGTLTFLYRMLFLLYAEARDLLPINEQRGYHGKSLTRLKAEVAKDADNIEDQAPARLEQAYNAHSTELYDRLTELFVAIDAGDPNLNVPLYNGGLFSTQPADEDTSPEAASARFLMSHKIPDRYLAQGLDLLSRDVDAKTQALAFIDYKSLGVRQLGSVYEGLLEFKLRVAREPMVVVKGKKTEEVIPEREVTGKVRERLPKGAVYLENDKRERKASGSYYTPDYIVKYIVAHTVGPVLEEKLVGLWPKLREAQRKHSEAVQRHTAFQKQDMQGDDPEKVANTYRSIVDELFDLRVLDPAMGSGHFLVEAVDFITDNMLKFLNAFPWNPVIVELRRTRESILGEMERQGVSIDPARLTDVNLLKRHILKRCIYGVDVNPMAVELAKVSLWLDSFTLGAPLSFLDHHLKCGNSLIGVWDIEAYIAPGSTRWNDFMRNLAAMVQVSSLTDSTVGEIEESNRLFEESQKWITPTKERLNVALAAKFTDLGNISQAMSLAYVPEADRVHEERSSVEKFAHSQQIAQEKSFFHWKLEFPEVFVDLERQVWKASAGFHAVVGNPPYINAIELSKKLGEADKAYWKSQFTSAKGAFDIYILFLEQSLNLASANTNVGLITPNKFLAAPFGVSFREYLINNHTIVVMRDVSRIRVFDDASVYPIVSILKRGLVLEPYSILVEQVHPDHMKRFEHSSELLKSLPDYIWGFLLTEGSPLVHKLGRQSATLADVSQVNASTTAAEADSYSSCLRDDSSSGWQSAWRIINTGLIDRFANLWGLEPLTHQHKVYGYPVLPKDAPVVSDNRAKQYSSPKIIFAKMALKIEGYVDREGLNASMNTNFAIQRPGDYSISYLGAITNSKLLSWLYQQYFGALIMAGEYIQFQAPQLRILPIRRITFTTPPRNRTALSSEGHKLYTQCLAQQSWQSLLDLVEQRLAQQPEEADVVHDLLAYLADQMLGLNNQKQTEQKRFLSWLESALAIRPDNKGKTGLDALTGKSKIRSYLGDYQKSEEELPFTELQSILFQNKARLGASLSDAGLIKRIQDEYEASLAVLRPIKSQLAFTDSLIDQVVYRLYGLTEEEIALVEGNAIVPILVEGSAVGE